MIGPFQSVWGSFWREGQWGYGCCHSFLRNSYCIGEAGKLPAIEFNTEIAAVEKKKKSNEEKGDEDGKEKTRKKKKSKHHKEKKEKENGKTKDEQEEEEETLEKVDFWI